MSVLNSFFTGVAQSPIPAQHYSHHKPASPLPPLPPTDPLAIPGAGAQYCSADGGFGVGLSGGSVTGGVGAALPNSDRSSPGTGYSSQSQASSANWSSSSQTGPAGTLGTAQSQYAAFVAAGLDPAAFAAQTQQQQLLLQQQQQQQQQQMRVQMQMAGYDPQQQMSAQPLRVSLQGSAMPNYTQQLQPQTYGQQPQQQQQQQVFYSPTPQQLQGLSQQYTQAPTPPSMQTSPQPQPQPQVPPQFLPQRPPAQFAGGGGGFQPDLNNNTTAGNQVALGGVGVGVGVGYQQSPSASLLPERASYSSSSGSGYFHTQPQPPQSQPAFPPLQATDPGLYGEQLTYASPPPPPLPTSLVALSQAPASGFDGQPPSVLFPHNSIFYFA